VTAQSVTCLERAIEVLKMQLRASDNRVNVAEQESLLLLARCTNGLGVLSVACSHFPLGAATENRSDEAFCSISDTWVDRDKFVLLFN